MRDLLLIGVPLRQMNYPPMALALLKSILHRNGYDVGLSDANLEYFRHCGGTMQDYNFNTVDLQNRRAFTWRQVEESHFGQWCRQYVKEVLARHEPRAVGLSVFSFDSNLVAYIMARIIRELAPPDTVILMGGYGASMPLQFAREIDAPEAATLAETCKRQGLINSYILGDGEKAIVDFMRELDQGRDYEQKVKFEKLDDLDGVPYPDYHDLELDSYKWHSEQQTTKLTLPITGSKGCVRRCQFCDVPSQFGKWVQRDGASMAHEAIHNYEEYGATTAYLTDSLVNGSMKDFMLFISTLAELRTKKGYNDLEWTGQYITRPAHQIPHDRDYYALMKASGCGTVSVGAESGSNRVLKDMDKKMRVEDLFTELDHFRKHGLSMLVNVLVSYPTETREDFEETILMLKNWQTYFADKTLEKIGAMPWWFGTTDSPWSKRMGPDQGFYAEKDDMYHWWYAKNPELDLKERIYRRMALSKVVTSLNFPLALSEKYQIKQMKMWADSYGEGFNKWLNNLDEYKRIKANGTQS